MSLKTCEIWAQRSTSGPHGGLTVETCGLRGWFDGHVVALAPASSVAEADLDQDQNVTPEPLTAVMSSPTHFPCFLTPGSEVYHSFMSPPSLFGLQGLLLTLHSITQFLLPGFFFFLLDKSHMVFIHSSQNVCLIILIVYDLSWPKKSWSLILRMFSHLFVILESALGTNSVLIWSRLIITGLDEFFLKVEKYSFWTIA